VQIRAKSGDGGVVLDELAWVRGAEGEVSLYIGHVSRLIRFLHDASARNRFPPAVDAALRAAEEIHERWRREVDRVFDTSFLEAIEPPVRVVLDATGHVQRAEHVFGASWPHMREGLRAQVAPFATGSAVTAEEPPVRKTSIEEFVQACERAASWLLVPNVNPALTSRRAAR
jgi:hypothetical protein